MDMCLDENVVYMAVASAIISWSIGWCIGIWLVSKTK